MHKAVLTEIRQRLAAALGNLAAGNDVSPATRYRLEGLCEAALLLGTRAELEALVAKEYAALGIDDAAVKALPHLSLWMPRAPVYPSTKD